MAVRCSGTLGAPLAGDRYFASLGFALPRLLPVEEVRDEHERERRDGDDERHVAPGRVLDVAHEVAEVGHGEHRHADEVLEVDGGAVGRVVGVALGVEVLVRLVDLDDAVRGHVEVLVQDEGDRVADLHVLGLALVDPDEGACVVGRLHRAGEHGVDLEAEQAHADERGREHDGKDDQRRRCDPPYALEPVQSPVSSLALGNVPTLRRRMRAAFVCASFLGPRRAPVWCNSIRRRPPSNEAVRRADTARNDPH